MNISARRLGFGALAMLAAALAAAPADAQRYDGRHDNRGEHRGRDRGRDEWRHRGPPPPVYYRERPVYAPPPVYYAPRQPGVNLFLPFGR